MAFTVHVPWPLREHTGGVGSVTVDADAATVREALAALFDRHPGLRDRIVTERGEPRLHVNLFVGPESIRTADGLDTAVGPDAELTILPAVSGG